MTLIRLYSVPDPDPDLLEPGSCTGFVQTSVRGGDPPGPGAELRSGAEPLVPEDLSTSET